MTYTIYAGVVGCDFSEDFFKNVTSTVEKFYWKKVLATGETVARILRVQPHAEIVATVEAIANDHDISLVFVSKHSLAHIKPIIDSGKSVRVI